MDYKQEIASTRVGCLGSSDAALLARIDNAGGIPKSAKKRLAVVKGLLPNEEIPQTAAIRAGDAMELAIYEHLSAQNDGYQSNPLWVSRAYSKRNVKLISHPDIVFEDINTKTLYVYEVKTTKKSVEETKNTYRAQLYIHNIIAKERAAENGKDWKVKLFLVHYDTSGLDLEQDIEFDPSRMTLHEIRMWAKVFDVDKAMTITDNYLETLTEYYDEDEVDANLLPANVKQEFDRITNVLIEIKEREQKVEEFKKTLYAFLKEKNIKSIKNEVFSVTRIDDTQSIGFDHKRFLEDYAKEHRNLYRKLIRKYEKVTNRKGYVLIKLKK